MNASGRFRNGAGTAGGTGLPGAHGLSSCENHWVGEVLTFEQAASLDAESFRAYYLSDLIQRARSRMP